MPCRQPQTRLVADVITEDAWELTREEDFPLECIEHLTKVFPDTDSGLDRAVAWAEDHDVNEEGNIYREALRPEWATLKPEFQYDLTGEVFHVEEGDWEFPEDGD